MATALTLGAFLASFARCEEPKTPDTPEAVMASYLAEVSALAGEFPELADFPDYVKGLRKELAKEGKQDAEPRSVRFVRHMGAITTKRGPRPSDFGKNGIYLLFELADASDPRPAETHTMTNLRNLNLTLFAEAHLSEKPSPGLERRLFGIEKRHKAMLVQINDNALKK